MSLDDHAVPSPSPTDPETEELLHRARRLRWDADTLAIAIVELRAKVEKAIAAADAAQQKDNDPQ
jgi:hypothetical protein